MPPATGLARKMTGTAAVSDREGRRERERENEKEVEEIGV